MVFGLCRWRALCFCTEPLTSLPLHCLLQVQFALGNVRFPVLNSFRWYGLAISCVFRLAIFIGCWVDYKINSVIHWKCLFMHFRKGNGSWLFVGMRNVEWEWMWKRCIPNIAFYAKHGRQSSTSWPFLMWKGSCVPMSIEECYLVDPASSHMLVSKIKPCMCKYELIQTVKLRMAH